MCDRVKESSRPCFYSTGPLLECQSAPFRPQNQRTYSPAAQHRARHMHACTRVKCRYCCESVLWLLSVIFHLLTLTCGLSKKTRSIPSTCASLALLMSSADVWISRCSSPQPSQSQHCLGLEPCCCCCFRRRRMTLLLFVSGLREFGKFAEMTFGPRGEMMEPSAEGTCARSHARTCEYDHRFVGGTETLWSSQKVSRVSHRSKISFYIKAMTL